VVFLVLAAIRGGDWILRDSLHGSNADLGGGRVRAIFRIRYDCRAGDTMPYGYFPAIGHSALDRSTGIRLWLLDTGRRLLWAGSNSLDSDAVWCSMAPIFQVYEE